MPEDGVPLTPTNKILSSAEVVRVAKLFVSQGVDKVRITGGEPLLRKDLPRIIGMNMSCIMVACVIFKKGTPKIR